MANPWWVWYNVQSGHPAQVIEEPSAAQVQKVTGFQPLAGPFTTRAAAEQWLASSGTARKTTPKPISLTSPFATIGDFLDRLTEASTWERVGEVILGLILIAVGLARITPVVPLANDIAKAIK